MTDCVTSEAVAPATKLARPAALASLVPATAERSATALFTASSVDKYTPRAGMTPITTVVKPLNAASQLGSSLYVVELL